MISKQTHQLEVKKKNPTVVKYFRALFLSCLWLFLSYLWLRVCCMCAIRALHVCGMYAASMQHACSMYVAWVACMPTGLGEVRRTNVPPIRGRRLIGGYYYLRADIQPHMLGLTDEWAMAGG